MEIVKWIMKRIKGKKTDIEERKDMIYFRYHKEKYKSYGRIYERFNLDLEPRLDCGRCLLEIPGAGKCFCEIMPKGVASDPCDGGKHGGWYHILQSNGWKAKSVKAPLRFLANYSKK